MVYICTISKALGLKLTDIHNSSLFEQKGNLLSHTRSLELGWIPGSLINGWVTTPRYPSIVSISLIPRLVLSLGTGRL